MGYYGNAYVFTTPPCWEGIASALPETVAVRAYRHRNHRMWLLDLWHPGQAEHWAFTEDLSPARELGVPLPDSTAELLRVFDNVCKALPKEEMPYGLNYLAAAAEMSIVGEVPCFFFAADDELLDMACNASQGSLLSFRVRLSRCTLGYSGENLVVTPFVTDEEPALALNAKDLRAVSEIRGVTVAPSQLLEGGLPLYDNAVRLWPSGDPIRLLGVGTWDPFENVKDDLETEFERVPQPRRRDEAARTLSPGYATPLLHREFESLRWLRRLFTWMVYGLGVVFVLFILFVLIAALIEFLR